MDFIHTCFDFVRHLDVHLQAIVQDFGMLTYLILFFIIFAETGLVVTPFLPGDSLLFAAGALAATGSLDHLWLFVSLSLAAVLGDSVNYAVGKFIGPKVFQRENSRIFKKEYLEKTHQFYEKYGRKTIVIARFVPIVRTFAPFVAGVGRMNYASFLMFNVSGGVFWVGLLVFAGYYFGNMPIVKQNFSSVILIIIFLSILPGIIEYWKHSRWKPACRQGRK